MNVQYSFQVFGNYSPTATQLPGQDVALWTCGTVCPHQTLQCHINPNKGKQRKSNS